MPDRLKRRKVVRSRPIAGERLFLIDVALDMEQIHQDAFVAEHWRTYTWFIRAVLIFAGHCLVILAILGLWLG